MKMKTLKLKDKTLHRRFKALCATNQVSMLQATDRMMRQWCEDVEMRRLDLRLIEQPRDFAAILQTIDKPSRHQEHAASDQQENPSGERKSEDSTRRGKGEK